VYKIPLNCQYHFIKGQLISVFLLFKKKYSGIDKLYKIKKAPFGLIHSCTYTFLKKEHILMMSFVNASLSQKF
jgi:hypothetical protein